MRRSTLLIVTTSLLFTSGCAASSTLTAPPTRELSSSSGDEETRALTPPPDPCEPLKGASEKDDATAAGRLEDLSICEESTGRLVEALKNAQRALEHAIGERNAGVMSTSRARVTSLLDRIPHVTFAIEQSADTDDLSVQFDGRPVPIDALTKKFSIDPGDHVVQAVGKRHGRVVRQLSKIRVNENDFVAIRLSLQ